VRIESAKSELAEAIGFLTTGASIFFVFSAFRELRRAKTAFDVRKPTQALVEMGVFTLSRNPVYLSIVLLYIGTAFLMNSFWMLLLFLPTGSAFCLVVSRNALNSRAKLVAVALPPGITRATPSRARRAAFSG
jgi:protein-S-isoprenylcysteine O-methyltransferase Ste14